MDKIINLKNRKVTIVFFAVLAIAVVAVGTMLVIKKLEGPKKIYEALVMTKDQTNANLEEDARTSLKAGDVVSIFPEGHKWSMTEKQSYLILKMNLTDKEAQKLIQPEQRDKKIDSSAKQDPALDKNQPKIAGPQKETIRARAYHLKIEKINFDSQKFSRDHQQPFPDKVFDDDIIQKKYSFKQ